MSLQLFPDVWVCTIADFPVWCPSGEVTSHVGNPFYDGLTRVAFWDWPARPEVVDELRHCAPGKPMWTSDT